MNPQTALDRDAVIEQLSRLDSSDPGDAAIDQPPSTVRELKAELDTLMSQLRQPVEPDPFADETGLRRAQELVLAIGLEPETKGHTEQSEPGRPELGRIGPYELLEKLGQGGMGAVYKALHTSLEKIVALKVLPRDRLNPAAIARFKREMKAVGKLDHPNIVRATDAGEADGTRFLVMEYVEGSDLSDLVKKNGPLAIDKALTCVLQAARGLEFAHANGVVHRDIKPANLLLDRSGTIKILDMGLARLDSAGGQQDQLTGTGQIMGTVDYMAPEQAMDTKSADARADIYSLGVTLWNLLTGRALYEGDTTVMKLMAHQNKPIPSLHAACPVVSADLEAVFNRMVAKTPEARYQTMTEVIADLERCQAGEASSPTLSMGQGEDSRLNAFLRGMGQAEAGHGTVAGAAPMQAAAMASPTTPAMQPTINLSSPAIGTDPQTQQSLPQSVLGALAGHRVAGKNWLDRLPVPPRYRLPLLIGGGLAAAALLLAGILLFWQTDQGTVRIEINDPNITVQLDGQGATLTHLDKGKIKLEPGQHGLRINYGDLDFETAKFVLADGDDVQLKVELQNGQVQVANGAAPLGVKPMSTTSIASSQDARQVPVAESTGSASAGEARVAVPGNVPAWGTLLRESNEHAGGVWCVDLSADGQVGVSGGGGGYANETYDFRQGRDYDVRIWDVRSGTQRWRLSGHTDIVRAVVISQDGSHALSGSWDRTARLWDVQAGRQLHVFSGHAQAIAGVAFVPQTDQVVSVSTDGTLRVWDRNTAAQLHSYELGRAQFHCVAVSPDGRLAYCGTKDQSIRIVDLASGKVTGELADLAGLIHSVAISSDARLIVAANGNAPGCLGAVWEAAGGKQRFQLAGHVAQFVNKSQQLLVGGENGELQLLSTVDGRILHQFRAHSKVTQGVASSLDGRILMSGSWDGSVKFWSGVNSAAWHGWPADAPDPAIAPFDAQQARQFQEAWADHLGVPVEYENSIGMKFRLIPPGEFTMGSTPAEIEAALKVAGKDPNWRDRFNSEVPQHQVVLTQPVYVAVTEVTQAQYEQVMGTNPSHFSATGEGKAVVANLDTGNHPVESVSWNDAADFCTKLSQQEELKPFYFRSGKTITPLDGTGYRLPTEAEWESACRAGTTTRFWSGDDDHHLIQAGWFGSNSGGHTHAAGELKANPFGLSDVNGNVWEWVQDSWDPTFYGKFQENAAINPSSSFSAGSKRVIRGGVWNSNPSVCRSSTRHARIPSGRDFDFGFRVVLVAESVRVSRP